MSEDTVVVLITVPSEQMGLQMGRSLVENRLAACANLLGPVHSLYRWKGEVQEDRESLLLIKTRAELVETELIPAVRAIHPYELPEIIALPIVQGLPPYLAWILENTIEKSNA